MYSGYSEIEVISAVLLAFLATISLAATLITLYLINDMNRWNGYMLLIFNLTLFQAIYDISFYFLLAFRSNACFQIFTFLATFSGLAVSMWTNIISCVLFYIVIRMKSFHIKYYVKFFLGFIVVSCGVLATLTVVFAQHHPVMLFRIQHDYYYFRILSIIVNVIIHIIIQIKLYNLGLSSLNRINAGGRYVNIKAINDPLKVLSARLKYYPIVQICTWIGAAWYEFEYGFNRDSFDATHHYSVWQQICIYVDVICSPIAGLGFFIIFLVVQPTAYAHFRMRIRQFCGKEDKDTDYQAKLNNDSHYSNRRNSSYDSTYTATHNEVIKSSESFTENLMNNTENDGADFDVVSTTSGTGYQKRLHTGSFYEMDEEELAQHMETKYYKKNSFTFYEPRSYSQSGSISIAGFNTVNLNSINSIPNTITSNAVSQSNTEREF